MAHLKKYLKTVNEPRVDGKDRVFPLVLLELPVGVIVQLEPVQIIKIGRKIFSICHLSFDFYTILPVGNRINTL